MNASCSLSNSQVVIPIGAAKNRVRAKQIENNVIDISAILLGGFSFNLGSDIYADHCSVENPIFIDSNKPTIPRIRGFFK